MSIWARLSIRVRSDPMGASHLLSADDPRSFVLSWQGASHEPSWYVLAPIRSRVGPGNGVCHHPGGMCCARRLHRLIEAVDIVEFGNDNELGIFDGWRRDDRRRLDGVDERRDSRFSGRGCVEDDVCSVG